MSMLLILEFYLSKAKPSEILSACASITRHLAEEPIDGRAAMNTADKSKLLPQPQDLKLRRQFLGQLAATGAFAALWPALAEALEGWEVGDPLCRLPEAQLPKPNGYE